MASAPWRHWRAWILSGARWPAPERSKASGTKNMTRLSRAPDPQKAHDSVLDRMSVARQCIGTGSKFGHQRIGKRRVARRGIGEFSNGSLLLGVMENDSQSIALACDKRADAMTVIDRIGAALALDRAVMHGEHHAVAVAERHHAGAGLGAGPLLGHHEFAAGEVPARLGQKNRHLQREDMLAIKILVQAIVIARAIFEQQGRGTALSGLVAALEIILMRGGIG